MTENIKNNIIRTTGVILIAFLGFLGFTACDTSSECDDTNYSMSHYDECQGHGAISPYGYGINY